MDRGISSQDIAANLKQQALLFDQIGITNLGFTFRTPVEQQWDNDLSWLQENGLIFTIPYPPKKDEINTDNEQINYWFNLLELQNANISMIMETMLDKARKANIKKANKTGYKIVDGAALKKWSDDLFGKIPVPRSTLQVFGEKIIQIESIALRVLALQLESLTPVTAVSLLPLYSTLPHPTLSSDFPKIPKHDVVRIIINKLPIPSETTPWEAILDYRNDPETQKSLHALRRWIRKLSSENISPVEISDELETLIDEYQGHMKLHKMKANTETLEVILKIPFEILENLLKIKFSKIPEPFFAIKKRQISLMEAEINAPGREIAYILKTNEKFLNS